jgi:hypothetical protein
MDLTTVELYEQALHEAVMDMPEPTSPADSRTLETRRRVREVAEALVLRLAPEVAQALIADADPDVGPNLLEIVAHDVAMGYDERAIETR